jgi:hypothetical protein
MGSGLTLGFKFRYVGLEFLGILGYSWLNVHNLQ